MIETWIEEWILEHCSQADRVLSAQPFYTWRTGSPLKLVLESAGRPWTCVLRWFDDSPGDRCRFQASIAALEAAERYSIPAPRLIAAADRGAGKTAILLESHLPGSSTIPVKPVRRQLLALGELVALFSAAKASASAGLYVSGGPFDIGNSAFERRRARDFDRCITVAREAMLHQVAATNACSLERARAIVQSPNGGRSELLEMAADVLDQVPTPTDESVVVHGDLWLGNVVWDLTHRVVGVVDWGAAGVGHPGIDLASARLDATLMYGQEAADLVLLGWKRRARTEMEVHTLAYWDAKAGINTPADMRLPVYGQYGRGDLSSALAASRRDTFVRDALRVLNGAA
jgi:fructosamine-3-kinase